MKTPEQIRREVMDAVYGIGTEWEEPNEHGEEGFTRALIESDIDADDIGALIERAIEIDRAQRTEDKTLIDGIEVDVSTVEHQVEQYPAGSLLTLHGAWHLLDAWVAKDPGQRSWAMPRDVPLSAPLPLFATWRTEPAKSDKTNYVLIEPVLTDRMGPYYALKDFGEIKGLTPPALPQD